MSIDRNTTNAHLVLIYDYKRTFRDSHADSQLSRVAQKREVQRESVFRIGDESEMI